VWRIEKHLLGHHVIMWLRMPPGSLESMHRASYSSVPSLRSRQGPASDLLMNQRISENDETYV
jgi:hypothetical protein